MVFDHSRDMFRGGAKFRSISSRMRAAAFARPAASAPRCADLMDKLKNGHGRPTISPKRETEPYRSPMSHCVWHMPAIRCSTPSPSSVGVERRLQHKEFEPAFNLDWALDAARQMTGRDDAGRTSTPAREGGMSREQGAAKGGRGPGASGDLTPKAAGVPAPQASNFGSHPHLGDGPLLHPHRPPLRGDGPTANSAGRRQWLRSNCDNGTGGDMSASFHPRWQRHCFCRRANHHPGGAAAGVYIPHLLPPEFKPHGFVQNMARSRWRPPDGVLHHAGQAGMVVESDTRRSNEERRTLIQMAVRRRQIILSFVREKRRTGKLQATAYDLGMMSRIFDHFFRAVRSMRRIRTCLRISIAASVLAVRRASATWTGRTRRALRTRHQDHLMSTRNRPARRYRRDAARQGCSGLSGRRDAAEGQGFSPFR